MNRRTFLRYSLTTGAFLTLSACNKLLGKSSNTMQDHDMHSMGDMSGHMMSDSTTLLPVDALPTGAPLATLPLLKNLSSEPNTFKASLTAKESSVELVKGKPTKFWTYNGQVPGPQIVVNEGDTVTITFKNNLSQSSTIHWHGLPVPSEQDGNPHDPVPPNGERDYIFTLPIGSAGTYWYHTHAHGYSAEQAFRGLAGTLIVKSKEDPLAYLPEQHLAFSDLRLDINAQIPANNMMDWMNGREGQFVLCNGQHQPKIDITTTQRLRIWNACSARYLNLNLQNCEFIVVGTDGGLLAAPAQPVANLLIAPAERFEVIIRAKKSGTFTLQALPYNRQKMMETFKPNTLDLASINIQAIEPNLPAQLRSLPSLGVATSQKKVTFSEMPMDEMMSKMKGQSDSQTAVTGMFYVNGQTFDMNRIDMTSQQGEVEEWLLFNNSHMDHPFHLHGTQFEIIEHINDDIKTLPPYRSRKDTVNLRPNERVRIKAVQQFKGLRMFHCHILEHEAVGMMGQLMVK